MTCSPDHNPNGLQVLYTTNVTGGGGLHRDLVLANVFGASRPQSVSFNDRPAFNSEPVLEERGFAISRRDAQI